MYRKSTDSKIGAFFTRVARKIACLHADFGEHRDKSRNSQSVFLVVARFYGSLLICLFSGSFFLFGSFLFCCPLFIFGFFFHFFCLINQLFNEHPLYKHVKT